MNIKKVISLLLLAVFAFGAIAPVVSMANETTVSLISTIVTVDIPGGKQGKDIIYVGNGNKEDKPSIRILDINGNFIDEGKMIENPEVNGVKGVEAVLDENGNLIITNKTNKNIEKIFVQYSDNDEDNIYDEISISVVFTDGTTSGDIPKTGDNMPLAVASTVAVGSLLVIGGILLNNKKDAKNDDKDSSKDETNK